MNTNKETSINQLLNLYEQNDLTGFTTLLNSEEINVNKTQQRNLLSYITTSKQKHDNDLNFLNAIYNNGTFNFKDPSIILLALMEGKKPEIAQSIFENNKEDTLMILKAYSTNTFKFHSFKEDKNRNFSYFKNKGLEGYGKGFSIANMFSYTKDQETINNYSGLSEKLANNLLNNPEILLTITNLLFDVSSFVNNLLVNPSPENNEAAFSLINTILKEGAIDEDVLFHHRFLENPEFRENSEFDTYILDIHAKKNNISNIIEYRKYIEYFIQSNDYPKLETFINSVNSQKDDPAGLTFFKILKNHSYSFLKKYHEDSEDVKLSKNVYKKVTFDSTVFSDFKEFSLKAFSLILNKYDTPKEDQLFKNTELFNNYTSWFKYYNMEEHYSLMEKSLLSFQTQSINNDYKNKNRL